MPMYIVELMNKNIQIIVYLLIILLKQHLNKLLTKCRPLYHSCLLKKIRQYNFSGISMTVLAKKVSGYFLFMNLC